MGHSTYTRFIDLAAVERAFAIGESRTDAALRLAINAWRDDAERYGLGLHGDERAGWGSCFSILRGTSRSVAESCSFPQVRDGHSAAIPVFGTTSVSDVQDTVELDGARAARLSESGLARVAAQKLELQRKCAIVPGSFSIVAGQAPAVFDHVVHKGTPSLKWEVRDRDGRSRATASSKGTAIRAAEHLLVQQPNLGHLDLVQTRHYDDAAPAIRITRRPETGPITLTVTARIEIPTPNSQLLGWVVAFDYHH